MRVLKLIGSVYLSKYFFGSIGILILAFFLGSIYPLALLFARVLLLVFGLMLLVELVQLFRIQDGLVARRHVPEKLSNGDENHIYITLKSTMPYDCRFMLIDELPVQFQSRDKTFLGKMGVEENKTVDYTIRPTERGEYTFGNVNVYVSTFTHMIQRRYRSDAEEMTKVYPSIIQVKKYSFLAVSDFLSHAGIKKIRRIGHNYEFDQIREFVPGDDVRSINWKATARTSQIMVNQYQDEKSQDVYAIINKGRVMQLPFEELTLLDYAINSSLVMLNTAYTKDDYPGLITFNKEVSAMVISSKKKTQITEILETLYNQETDFSEANYAKLAYWVRQKIKKRALIFLYTNFEGLTSLYRELPYLKTIARHQRLIVVLFKNVELNELLDQPSKDTEAIYTKTIATKFQIEKQLIVKELHKHGIDAILTSPYDLTVNTINKYLEIKARGVF
ncbi:MAG: DUF58 domain-containing protein [Cyclobacteriaceae bacterium]|nr:DUF58 domain-containing protein [Cyclobacteriaceae bacterium]